MTANFGLRQSLIRSYTRNLIIGSLEEILFASRSQSSEQIVLIHRLFSGCSFDYNKMESTSKSTRSGVKPFLPVPSASDLLPILAFQSYKIPVLDKILRKNGNIFQGLKDVSESYVSSLQNYLRLGEKKFNEERQKQKFSSKGNDGAWEEFEVVILHLVILINREISLFFTKNDLAEHATRFLLRREGVILAKMKDSKVMFERTSVEASVKQGLQKLSKKLQEATELLNPEFEKVLVVDVRKAEQIKQQLRKFEKILNEIRNTQKKQLEDQSKVRDDIKKRLSEFEEEIHVLDKKNVELLMSTGAMIK